MRVNDVPAMFQKYKRAAQKIAPLCQTRTIGFLGPGARSLTSVPFLLATGTWRRA